MSVLCRTRRQNQDCFDNDDAAISNMIAEKNCVRKTYVNRRIDDNKAAFYHGRRLVQQRLREMLDAWTGRKAEEIQGLPTVPQPKELLLFSTPTEPLYLLRRHILKRLVEHYRGLLNRASTIFYAAIARLPQVETDAEIDLPPSLLETISAAQHLSSVTVPGSDAMPAEIYKKGGRQLMDNLTAPFQEM
nr:unnamed protein product [Spirometra erinaceieuropaei]